MQKEPRAQLVKEIFREKGVLYNEKDVRLPCALCGTCNAQLSNLKLTQRNASFPKKNLLLKTLQNLPRNSRSSNLSECLSPCHVCKAAQNAANSSKISFQKRPVKRGRPPKSKPVGRPPLQDMTNKRVVFEAKQLTHDMVNHIQKQRRLTNNQVLGLFSDLRQGMESRKVVEPGLKKAIEERKVDDLFVNVSVCTLHPPTHSTPHSHAY